MKDVHTQTGVVQVRVSFQAHTPSPEDVYTFSSVAINLKDYWLKDN